MSSVIERFSDWIRRSISQEGIVLTAETQQLVDWLARVQRRSVAAVVNDLLAAELEQQRRNEAGPPRWGLLTPREQDVAVLFLRGYSTSQIARTLGVEPVTVRSHLLHIQQKYGIQGKNELRQRLLADQRDAQPQPPPLGRPGRPPRA